MAKYTLVGLDGNAFNIMGYVLKCMRKENVSQEERNAYQDEAMNGDYNHLLATSMKAINKLNEG